MIRIIFKLGIYASIVAGGGFLAFQTIPALRATIVEYVNPRAKEARLLLELGNHLDTLNESLAGESATEGGSSGAQAQIQKAKQTVQEVESLIAEITQINEKNDGIVQGIIGKALDAISPRQDSLEESSGGQAQSTSDPSVPSSTVTPTLPPCTQ